MVPHSGHKCSDNAPDARLIRSCPICAPQHDTRRRLTGIGGVPGARAHQRGECRPQPGALRSCLRRSPPPSLLRSPLGMPTWSAAGIPPGTGSGRPGVTDTTLLQASRIFCSLHPSLQKPHPSRGFSKAPTLPVRPTLTEGDLSTFLMKPCRAIVPGHRGLPSLQATSGCCSDCLLLEQVLEALC